MSIAEVSLTSSERKLETISQNMANARTAGYKSQISFSDVLELRKSDNTDNSGFQSYRTTLPEIVSKTDFSQGKLIETKSPIDFAITGDGFFKVRSVNESYFTRKGEFQVIEGGRLATAEGMVLLQSDGSDVVLESLNIEVLEDGTIMEQGQPVGRIGVFSIEDQETKRSHGGVFFTADEGAAAAASAKVHQGMSETANVNTSTQMLQMMAAVREAESASKFVQTYDSLMGQAISTFKQS